MTGAGSIRGGTFRVRQTTEQPMGVEALGGREQHGKEVTMNCMDARFASRETRDGSSFSPERKASWAPAYSCGSEAGEKAQGPLLARQGRKHSK